MISPEDAVATLIAQSRLVASTYTNRCSYVVSTSEYKTAYPTLANEFDLDRQLANKTNPTFKLASI